MTADPSLDGATLIRPLAGLSGARVLLMTKDGRRWFVRKISRQPEHNDRLRGQIAKQLVFARTLGEVVHTPAVLEEGTLDGCAYFDMEFIRGSDGVSYLRRADNAAVVALADRFARYIEAVAAQPLSDASTATLFDALYRKLCDVQRRAPVLDDATLARLFTGLERVRDVGDGLARTLCHGDLTLENVVIDDRGEIWMLDLLDAPFEHYWQDLAKLHQDLEGGWYLLGQAPISRYVLDYVSRRVSATAAQLEPGYAHVHAILLAFTFVRILPYTRSERERAFVKQRVEHFARIAHGEHA